jgi:RNA:NAD 2'-phosphotransferase (TPT1/KptA family)
MKCDEMQVNSSKNFKNLIRESKFLSYMLRHGAKEHSLQMTSDGFVEIDELLRIPESRRFHLNLDVIKMIVNQNDKKRFELKLRENDKKWIIRASQGHSIKNLDDSQMMKNIENADGYPLVIHGTFNRFLPLIQQEGLKVMNRNHIHFTTGYPGDKDVISGMRKSCEVYIEIDLKKAMLDGIKFYISTNGVILTPGINGILDKKFFKNIKSKF